MRILIIAAGLSLLLDQITKIWVVFGLDLVSRLRIDVLPPILNFRYGENRGINFGLLDGGESTRWALVVVSLIITVALAIWVYRQHSHHLAMRISAGMVIGGALGNVLDRVLYGYVLDFLNMSCCGFQNPFVFNIADVFIFAGAAGLIFYEGRVKNPA